MSKPCTSLLKGHSNGKLLDGPFSQFLPKAYAQTYARNIELQRKDRYVYCRLAFELCRGHHSKSTGHHCCWCCGLNPYSWDYFLGVLWQECLWSMTSCPMINNGCTFGHKLYAHDSSIYSIADQARAHSNCDISPSKKITSNHTIKDNNQNHRGGKDRLPPSNDNRRWQ